MVKLLTWPIIRHEMLICQMVISFSRRISVTDIIEVEYDCLKFSCCKGCLVLPLGKSSTFSEIQKCCKQNQGITPPWSGKTWPGETFITARKRSLGQGNIFTPVCHSVHGGGVRGCSGGACVVAPGGMRGFIWGACMVLFGGVCVVLFGGACVVLFGGHAWFYLGGVRGFIWGGVHGFFRFSGYNEIRSMSGRYASYWNAFLFRLIFFCIWWIPLVLPFVPIIEILKPSFR